MAAATDAKPWQGTAGIVLLMAALILLLLDAIPARVIKPRNPAL